jgi:hypothetical protein
MSGLKRNILVILILFIISTAALANAGTSLMWATAAHLLIGNLFIGILEGLLLAKIYGISAKKCVNIFILANYFSAWVGFKIISQICPTLPLDIDNILPMFWVMVVASYILTIILEFPFAVFAFKGDNEWLKKSIRGTFLIQTVSYVIIFGWFGISSGTSLFTKTKVVNPSAIKLPDNVQIYYISSNDGDIYTGSICDRQWQIIYDLNSSYNHNYLALLPSKDNNYLWNLVAQLPVIGTTTADDVVIQEKLKLSPNPATLSDINA